MTPEKIQTLFHQAISQKAIYNKLDGISRNQIYNWLNNRGAAPTMGNMLDVLYQLKMITIHEPN